MKKYHKYVFNIEERKFIGKFEEMYKNESIEVYDSWHQEDSRKLERNIDFAILQNYNFNFIVDIGCGKGAITHRLKKSNNRVMGIDISETALNIAKERYPDIEFFYHNINDVAEFDRHLSDIKLKIDLVYCSEILSYIENWEELLKIISFHTDYLLISLFIPDNPIGFVKNDNELISEYKKYYQIIEWVSLHESLFTIIFCRSKKCDI